MGLRDRLRKRVQRTSKSVIERLIGEGNHSGVGESHGARTAAWPPGRMGTDGHAEPPIHPADLAESGAYIEAHADFALPMEIDEDVQVEPEPARVDPEVASAMLMSKTLHAAPTGSVAQGEWLPMPSRPVAQPEASPEPEPEAPPATPAAPREDVSFSEAEREAMEEEIVIVLKTVYDPEIPVDIYELGLIYGVDVAENGVAEIRMTLTSPNCPAAQSMPAEVETKTKLVAGVQDAMVDIVWDPPWGPEKMSEAARLELNIDF